MNFKPIKTLFELPSPYKSHNIKEDITPNPKPHETKLIIQLVKSLFWFVCLIFFIPIIINIEAPTKAKGPPTKSATGMTAGYVIIKGSPVTIPIYVAEMIGAKKNDKMIVSNMMLMCSFIFLSITPWLSGCDGA